MEIQFQATEIVQLQVPPAELPLQAYLHHTDRIMRAIADPTLTEQLSEEIFRLKMQPVSFLELYEFQPIVTLKIWCDRENIVHLQNLDYQIKGLEAFMENFRLELVGTLAVVTTATEDLELQGKADLVVSLELPPPLLLMPKSLLQNTGDRLLGEVLQRIKHQLLQQLLQDYQQWSASQIQS
ncbi:MAG: DUF1997 domain-containing protein [Limnothrix sp.]